MESYVASIYSLLHREAQMIRRRSVISGAHSRQTFIIIAICHRMCIIHCAYEHIQWSRIVHQATALDRLDKFFTTLFHLSLGYIIMECRHSSNRHNTCVCFLRGDKIFFDNTATWHVECVWMEIDSLFSPILPTIRAALVSWGPRAL